MPSSKINEILEKFEEKFNPYNLVFPEVDRYEVKNFLLSELQSFEKEIREETTDLLRSAYQIALRRGENTNWEAFKKQLKANLKK